MSSSSLKPPVESFGAILSMASRRIMKKPLIGSLTLVLSSRLVRRVASVLALRRSFENPASAAPVSA